jgi:hypothetical protein
MIQDKETFYWLFSSSAQTISTFVAFLVTGFALVLNMMENIKEKDETLDLIHDKLKSNYYLKIIILAIITGLAILFSLWMIFLNGGSYEYKMPLFIITALLNIAVIIFGIYFVMSIINPNRYRNIAKELIKKDTLEFSQTGENIDQAQFMIAFVKLEKKIRDIVQINNLKLPSDEPKISYTFGRMIKTLGINELINIDDYNNLIQLNNYRNLVFHGHQEQVDKGMFERLIQITQKIDEIKITSR